MKTAIAAAVSALLCGMAYAADDTTNNRVADDRSAAEVSAFEPLPGTERGTLNNGQLSTRDSYGHILSDPDLFAAPEQLAAEAEEPATAIEISQFEEHPGIERGPLNNGQLNSRDSYGHILSDPELFDTPQAVTDTEPATAIEISQFEEHPGIERGPLNNGQLNSRDSYGHILSDPKLFGNY
ncbi:MAG: hypothetical protein WC383_00905 [Gammaproteobacteria bacterium]